MKLKKIIFYLSIILILSGCGENSPNDNNNSNSNSTVSDNNNVIRIEKITAYFGEEKSNSPMATTTFEYDNKQRRVAIVMKAIDLSLTIRDTYKNDLLIESYAKLQDDNNTFTSRNYKKYIYDNENNLKEILHYRKHTYLNLKEKKWLEQKDHKLEKNSNEHTTSWESLHYNYQENTIKRTDITNITYDGNNMTRKVKDTFENETLISTTISDFSYDNKKILPFGNTPCIASSFREGSLFECANQNNIISTSEITSNFDSRRADDTEMISTDYIYNDNDLPLSSILRGALTFYQEYQYNIN